MGFEGVPLDRATAVHAGSKAAPARRHREECKAVRDAAPHALARGRRYFFLNSASSLRLASSAAVAAGAGASPPKSAAGLSRAAAAPQAPAAPSPLFGF